MNEIEAVRAAIPDSARDIKLNLQNVLQSNTLDAGQRWGVALACAVASRNSKLRDAVLADAKREVAADVIDDAFAAAALMAMNNVFYRFRHMIGKPAYAQLPARLRMNRLAKPATTKINLELFSLAVSAIHGCETCVKAHERVVLEGGMSEEQVHDAVRIAAVIHATAVALELGELSEVGEVVKEESAA